MSEADISNINDYFATLLSDVKEVEDYDDPEKIVDPKSASVDQLLDCMNAENAVERIAYRREVAGAAHKDFLRINKGEKGQISQEKSPMERVSKTVCFKHSRYEVSESNGFVEITIEKKCSDDFTFWLRTEDGSATSGEDYIEKNELMMMAANEKERVIKIEIKDDT